MTHQSLPKDSSHCILKIVPQKNWLAFLAQLSWWKTMLCPELLVDAIASLTDSGRQLAAKEKKAIISTPTNSSTCSLLFQVIIFATLRYSYDRDWWFGRVRSFFKFLTFKKYFFDVVITCVLLTLLLKITIVIISRRPSPCKSTIRSRDLHSGSSSALHNTTTPLNIGATESFAGKQPEGVHFKNWWLQHHRKWVCGADAEVVEQFSLKNHTEIAALKHT